MAFYNAYWDESGTHDPRILTIAGYIATERQWEAFAREWNATLSKEDIKTFHMKDFENPYGDFTERKGWHKRRKIDFQSKLIGIIKRRINIGIWTSVDVPAYEKLITGWRRERNGTPYGFCVKSIMAQVALWAEHFKRNEPIAHVIEDGAGYNHEIERAFRATFDNEELRRFFRLGSLSFETKGRAVQLQAADLLAYEVWKDEYNFRVLPPEQRRKRRTSFSILTEAPHLGGFFGWKELTRAVELEEKDYSRQFPSGVEINYRKPEVNAVTISADSSELDELLDELARFVEQSPQLTNSLIDSSANLSKAISVHSDSVPTAEADELRVLFKPNDFFFSFMAALRASEGQGEISE